MAFEAVEIPQRDTDEDIWDLSWTEEIPPRNAMYPNSMVRYMSFSGDEEEMVEALIYLISKGERIVEVDIIKREHPQRITGPDGHYHVIDGVEQSHNWTDCPENDDSSNFYTHEGRVNAKQ